MRDLEVPDDRPAAAAPQGQAGGPDPGREPALARLAAPRRPPTVMLALLALPDLPPVPAGAQTPAPDEETHPEPVAAPSEAPEPEPTLPRRRPATAVATAARPSAPPTRTDAPAPAGPRPAVLDRVWARDVDTLRRIAALLRTL